MPKPRALEKDKKMFIGDMKFAQKLVFLVQGKLFFVIENFNRQIKQGGLR